MKINVFVKPNEQSQTCLGYAMARKGRMKSNFKNSIMPSVVSTLMVCATFGLTACNSSTTKTNNTDEETTKVEETAKVEESELESLAAVLPKYSEVNNFSEGLARVCDKKTELWGFIDKTGKEVIPCKFYSIYSNFHDGRAIAMTDENTTIFIDKEGNKVFRLDQVYNGVDFSDGRLSICSSVYNMEDGNFPMSGDLMVFGHLGFLDTNGNVVIKPDTYEVPLGEGPIIASFSEGMCQVFKGGRLFYIDKNGKELDLSQFRGGGDFSDGMAWVWDDNWKIGFVDKTGKLVIPCKYDFTGQFGEGVAFVIKDDKLAIIDRNGKELTPFQFDIIKLWEDTEGEEMLISRFSEGLAWAAKDGKFGYVDKNGKTVIPFRYEPGLSEDLECFDQQPCFDFHQGVARVWDKATGKYGFIDKNGNEVIPYQFDQAEDVSEGLAVVKRGEQYGFVTPDGKYTLDIKN